MTSLPSPSAVKLGLVIDLDTCVGCHACVVACKSWNTQSDLGAPLSDQDPYGADPSGTFLNRVHSYEVTPQDRPTQQVHFPKSCLHCEDAPCVTVCPTGASYKRQADGIVLVNEDACIGCGLCACRLVAARGGFDLMPEMGTKPVNKYLPPRPRDADQIDILAPLLAPVASDGKGLIAWLDKALSKLPGEHS